MPQTKAVFRDALLRRTALLDLQAIWTEVAEHLAKFISTDAAPAKHGIRSKSESMIVPQPAIESVVGLIKTEYIGKLQKQLDNIDRSEVHVQGSKDQESQEQASRRPAGQGRSAQAKGHHRPVRNARARVTGRSQESGHSDEQGSE